MVDEDDGGLRLVVEGGDGDGDDDDDGKSPKTR